MPSCPKCAGEIKEGARKCPLCKEYLDADLAAQRESETAPPVPAAEEGEESGSSLIVTGVVELIFAGLTLVLGYIVGILTVIFAGWSVYKAFVWNAEYQARNGRSSGAAIAGMVMCVFAAILAVIFTAILFMAEAPE